MKFEAKTLRRRKCIAKSACKKVQYDLILHCTLDYYLFLLNKPHLIPFNTFPNDKILDHSILKAFTDDKMNLTQKLNFVTGWKKKTAFSPSHTMFLNAFFLKGG